MKVIHLNCKLSDSSQPKFKFIWEMANTMEDEKLIVDLLSNNECDSASFVYCDQNTNEIYGGLVHKKHTISESIYWNKLEDNQKEKFEYSDYRMFEILNVGVCENSYKIRRQISIDFFDTLSTGRKEAHKQLVWFEAENPKQALKIHSLYPNVQWFEQTLLMYTKVETIQDLNFMLGFR